MSSPVVDDQSRQNRSTANQWRLYSTHRNSLEKLLVPSRIGSERLCIVGAGNCNDFDLSYLAKTYQQVHLVDIDPQAIAGAIARQKAGISGNVQTHAPVDLTGAADIFYRWSRQPPAFSEVDHLAAQIHRGVDLQLPAPFDVVVSSCVLTQLISPARKALGLDHPRLLEFRLAMRDGHLATLARLLRPGGRAVIAIDLISSDSFKDLPRVAASDLTDLMGTLVGKGKTYPGLDPPSFRAALRSPVLRTQFCNPVFSLPWHWHLSLQRTFLVYGLTLKRLATQQDRAQPVSQIMGGAS